MLWGVVTREKATSNCLFENTSFAKPIPTICSACPCDLFIVIAYAKCTWNCFRRTAHIRLENQCDRGTMHMYPAWDPVKTSALITCDEHQCTMRRVPLKGPFDESRFCKCMMGERTLSYRRCGGQPLTSNWFKNSVEWHGSLIFINLVGVEELVNLIRNHAEDIRVDLCNIIVAGGKDSTLAYWNSLMASVNSHYCDLWTVTLVVGGGIIVGCAGGY